MKNGDTSDMERKREENFVNSNSKHSQRSIRDWWNETETNWNSEKNELD